MKVTEKDCAKCPVLRFCSAHITGGSWNPRTGVDPCEIEITDGKDGGKR